MNQSELISIWQSEDYHDYVSKYLVPYWKDKSILRAWSDVVTANFASRHSVCGSLSKEQAIEVCKARSNNGANNFTSTSLDASFIQKVVSYIAANVIEWHGKNIGAFANYRLMASGYMYTVRSIAKQGFIATMYKDKVVVGIDGTGLINHFHGDARYATGKIYEL